MLKAFVSLFHNMLEESAEPVSEERELQLAIYGILYEAAKSDQTVAAVEEDKIREIMERYFQIDDAAYEEIRQQAHRLHLENADMFQITREVRQLLDRDQRLTLLDELWEVAYADGTIDPHELAIIRRLADLIGLNHKEFIDSRIKVGLSQKSESEQGGRDQ